MNNNTYTCHKHNLPGLTSYCPECMHDFETARPASDMTPAERAHALRDLPDQLTVPFGTVHKRIEELVDRPVWTHEMGTQGFQRLIAEAESGRPDITNMIFNLPGMTEP